MKVSTKDMADILSISRKALLEKAGREKWQYVKRQGGKFWITESMSEDVQLAVLSAREVATKTQSESGQLFTQVTEAERDVAKLRMSIINAYNTAELSAKEFCKAFNAGEISLALKEAYGKHLSERTFYRWLSEFTQSGISGITPLYSSGNSRGGSGASLTDEEKDVLKHFYLDINRRSINHCFLALKANLPDTTATYQVCYRYLKSLPPAQVDRYRKGETFFEARHLPYIERNKPLYKSMEHVQGDHHILDRVVKYKGKLVRPWVSTFIDMRSGAVLGWCVNTNPSSQTILAAYYMMIVRFGIPLVVHVDNGKDYKGKVIKGQSARMKVFDAAGVEREEEVLITGAIVTCGSKLIYATPFHGQSKGVQERFYGVLEEYYSKNTGNYIGSNTSARVDEQRLFWRAINGKAKRDDVSEWADVVNEFVHWVHWYNTEWVSNAKGRKGLTPEQAFLENLPENLRAPDMETVELALTKAEVRTVSRNGIRIGSTEYWAEELRGLTGQQVIARLNLTNKNEVLVCDSKGKVLCRAYAGMFIETGNTEADMEFVQSVRKKVRAFVKDNPLERLSFKPKNMLEIAMEATGIETPQIDSYIPQIEKHEKEEKETEPKKGKYQNYFDADDLQILTS
ncbi:DDE-type integrase/transposase/recombinase [Treponema phagedenis]|uniref:Mu transposase C-terminal domain-containing protein n=1 Tax=Treponema phagedenis TaxID=162 RepID=UPI0011E69380|nr:Mu transposase C-terminal domain-containing protein [Treponema phagedenis]QEJ94142.1 DDE-type integrase/transposase/recombinase [Treponema phagedenis]